MSIHLHLHLYQPISISISIFMFMLICEDDAWWRNTGHPVQWDDLATMTAWQIHSASASRNFPRSSSQCKRAIADFFKNAEVCYECYGLLVISELFS